jgi:hypothetical protein
VLRTDLIRTVPELLDHHAQERAEAIAFVDDRRAITYGELCDTTARLAGHLQELGLQVGDRALIYTDNRVETAESHRRTSAGHVPARSADLIVHATGFEFSSASARSYWAYRRAATSSSSARVIPCSAATVSKAAVSYHLRRRTRAGGPEERIQRQGPRSERFSSGK